MATTLQLKDVLTKMKSNPGFQNIIGKLGKNNICSPTWGGALSRLNDTLMIYLSKFLF